ncbi:hypothetical protein [Sutcliffiella halmapala]|uniref:hypothetical protein n=1 Tax=Sutcliffiella halmapala TaxID=79882 RepID=UPI00099549F5|nr:hypothetical protein [Sutcliffiella halmapala]
MNKENCKGFIFTIMIASMLIGCSIDAQTNEPKEVNIHNMIFSFEGNEDFGEQYLTYEISMVCSDGLVINKNSIEPLFAGWIEERLIEHQIMEIVELEDNGLKIVGKVTFNAEELSKADIVKLAELDESVQGVLFKTMDGVSFQAVKVGESTELIEIGG